MVGQDVPGVLVDGLRGAGFVQAGADAFGEAHLAAWKPT